MDRVPLPPKDAQSFQTVCQFCIVGCGYNVYKWPAGKDGGPAPEANALGADFREAQGVDGEWISPNMHTVIKEKDGQAYSVAIVPDQACQVNGGLASVRGGGLAQTLYAADRPTKARLTKPLVASSSGHADATWDEAVDLGARVIKAVIDRVWALEYQKNVT
ncbi:MAG: arsenite oxidase large subunit, partial [Rhodospirillaceae bacterium]